MGDSARLGARDSARAVSRFQVEPARLARRVDLSPSALSLANRRSADRVRCVATDRRCARGRPADARPMGGDERAHPRGHQARHPRRARAVGRSARVAHGPASKGMFHGSIPCAPRSPRGHGDQPPRSRHRRRHPRHDPRRRDGEWAICELVQLCVGRGDRARPARGGPRRACRRCPRGAARGVTVSDPRPLARPMGAAPLDQGVQRDHR